MTDPTEPDERKVAVMLVAMQEMHQEIEAMLGKMQAAVGQAQAASQAITRAGDSILPTIEHVTEEAIDFSVQRSLEDLAAPATLALQEAIKPIRENLSTLAQHTGEIEQRTRHAMAWFSWKWIAMVAAGFFGVSMLAWVALAWQRDEIEQLNHQRRNLMADVAQMQSNAEALEKKGARIQLAQCGGRLCVVASRNQSDKLNNWRGPWKNEAGQPMVVPLGY